MCRGESRTLMTKLSMEVEDTPSRLISLHSDWSAFVNTVSVFYQRDMNFCSEVFFAFTLKR